MLMPWQPSATMSHLKKRAQLFSAVRAFFAERDVMEVDTPLLCHTSVTDPAIASIPAIFRKFNESAHEGKTYYLQTSPEYAMKRMLASGSGSIYQLSKAFRQGEVGRYHNPEFMMLEWYRIGFDHHALMDDMDALLQTVLGVRRAERITYHALFERYLHINPHAVTLAELHRLAKQFNLEEALYGLPKEECLNLLMTHVIEPHLGAEVPCFIYDFPVTLAALARIVPVGAYGNAHATASRFEVYYRGIELANGFHELADADEQRERFLANLRQRELLGLPALPIDDYFLGALQAGLPDCAGVALGFDRLVMLALGLDNIQAVLSFDFSRV